MPIIFAWKWVLLLGLEGTRLCPVLVLRLPTDLWLVIVLGLFSAGITSGCPHVCWFYCSCAFKGTGQVPSWRCSSIGCPTFYHPFSPMWRNVWASLDLQLCNFVCILTIVLHVWLSSQVQSSCTLTVMSCLCNKGWWMEGCSCRLGNWCNYFCSISCSIH